MYSVPIELIELFPVVPEVLKLEPEPGSGRGVLRQDTLTVSADKQLTSLSLLYCRQSPLLLPVAPLAFSVMGGVDRRRRYRLLPLQPFEMLLVLLIHSLQAKPISRALVTMNIGGSAEERAQHAEGERGKRTLHRRRA